MEKRTFNTEQKLAILKEASENGVNETLKKHGIFPATYYSWKKKFNTMGVEGFTQGMTPGQLKRIRLLEKENQMLKEIIVEKELEGRLKDELLIWVEQYKRHAFILTLFVTIRKDVQR